MGIPATTALIDDDGNNLETIPAYSLLCPAVHVGCRQRIGTTLHRRNGRLGGGSARFKPAKETGYEWGLYSGGLSYKFYSDTKYVGAIEIDLMFTQKGFNYDLAFESDESYHRRDQRHRTAADLAAAFLPVPAPRKVFYQPRHSGFVQPQFDLQPGIENHGHTRKRQVCHATQP